MKHRIAFCVGLAACAVAGATSAQAQPVYPAPPPGYVPVSPPPVHGGLPPNEILMIVRASGLRPLTQPARQDPRLYVLLASDNMGGQLRVVVNAFSGRIVHAAPAHDPRFAYHPARPRGYVPMPAPQHGTVVPPPSYRAAPRPDLREPTPPLPRAARAAPSPQAPAARASQNPSRQNPARQNPNLASAPDSTVPARPVRTPLPRPRPVVAASEAAAPAPAAPMRRALQETSPEAEAAPAAQPAPAPAPPSAAPAQPAPAETQMVPVAPLD